VTVGGGNCYLDLTREFNDGRVRAILSSGQAAVVHRIAMMSKDGDWILREDQEACRHILAVLKAHGARYRLGAPLDVRWLRGGWTSHAEFALGDLRVRTDLCTRPPRLSEEDLGALWHRSEGGDFPVVGLVELAEIKKTRREKDYPIIGEIARYLRAAALWRRRWTGVEAMIAGLSIREAHEMIVKAAEGVLPFELSEAS